MRTHTGAGPCMRTHAFQPHVPAFSQAQAGTQCMGTRAAPKSCAASAALQVTSVQAGDWVVPLSSALGTWRDTGVWQAADWHKLPAGLPLAAAATLAINPPTALLMLEDVVPLQPGDVLVQNGATSAVGQVRVAWLALAAMTMHKCCCCCCCSSGQATCVGVQRPVMAPPCASTWGPPGCGHCCT